MVSEVLRTSLTIEAPPWRKKTLEIYSFNRAKDLPARYNGGWLI